MNKLPETHVHELTTRPHYGFRTWVRINAAWYLFCIIVGAVCHKAQIEGFFFPLCLLTLGIGIVLGRGLRDSLHCQLLPARIEEHTFKSGAFVEQLRTHVHVIAARLNICVIGEWKISRRLPLPPICQEIPLLDKLSKLRDETTIRMVARDNRVQYCVNLSTLTSDDVLYSPEEGILRVKIPSPLLDEEFVAVQSDPGKIWVMSDKGFYDRLTDWFSGTTQKTQEMMRKRLRELVIQEANTPENIDLARKNAALELQDILKILIPQATELPVRKIDISFKPAAAAIPLTSPENTLTLSQELRSRDQATTSD